MARRGEREPMPGVYPVTYGEVELLRDLDRPGGWILTSDGVPQSYVDLDDPEYLDFEYVRLMADVIDLMEDGPLDVVHVGGGACTLPRYVAATRPGSRQIVVEPDAGLVQLVRDQLGLRSVPRLKVRIADGRAAGALLRDDSADLFVLDAFTGAVMPVELATVEYLEDVARVVRGGGTVLVNLADGKGLAFARRFMATITEAFPHVALLADPGVLRGRRFGNIIVAASRVSLPLDGLIRRAAGGPARARCMHGRALTDFIAGASPIHDGDAVTPPVPPPAVFGR
ncbi:spermidine synthase [Thermostaphylospora chromogena]|uniref:Spermidine synthase n=1 Tax=Thermostaphylospora chromogena TaxID=35622 RepID=A0A1H1A0C4_9ACTN|nr:fused MFS/spermidine synthase [Thermostaphylospora chromogena]SDQ33099.1 Spermidine synthase [Thermostaphylospora chromogena]